MTKAEKVTAPEVELALKELAAWLRTTRIAKELRQGDVADRIGVRPGTIHRLETVSRSISVGTLFNHLHAIGELDAVRAIFGDVEITEELKRHRKSAPKVFDTTVPTPGAKFLDFISRNPNAEAMITPTAAISLSKKGYAVRVEVGEEGKLTHYATSVETARASSFEYQGPDGEKIGGNVRCKLQVAVFSLTEARFGAVLVLEDELRTRMNDRIKEANLFISLDEIDLNQEIEQHTLINLNNDQVMNADPVIDILNHILSKVTVRNVDKVMK